MPYSPQGTRCGLAAPWAVSVAAAVAAHPMHVNGVGSIAAHEQRASAGEPGARAVGELTT